MEKLPGARVHHLMQLLGISSGFQRVCIIDVDLFRSIPFTTIEIADARHIRGSESLRASDPELTHAGIVPLHVVDRVTFVTELRTEY